MDLTLLGKNYEISRQTVPADSLFLSSIGININPFPLHENTRPTYSNLMNDLDALSGSGHLFTKTQIGTASNGDPIFSFTTGTSGKEILLFISGIHGNEEHAYIPTVRYMQLLDARAQSHDLLTEYILANYEVTFVPLLNPYGIRNLIRYNMN
jgi:hypothetical protein